MNGELRGLALRQAMRDFDVTELPEHVTQRISALLGEDDPIFADGSFHDGSGWAVAVGSRTVARAEFSGARARYDHDERTGPSTVEVLAWPRASLATVAIEATEMNSDAIWSQIWRHPFPPGTRATFYYQGGRKLEVTMPQPPPNGSSSAAELVADALAALLRDVGEA
jgi:hypothetical protein